MSSLQDLKQENEQLKERVEEIERRLECLKTTAQGKALFHSEQEEPSDGEKVTIIVIGASGDLAKKKTFPALFSLYCLDLLPPTTKIVGFARTKMSDPDFHKFLSQHFKGPEDKRAQFLKLCSYHSGQYDSKDSFVSLDAKLKELEGASGNRVFYMAIPPSIFYEVAKMIRHFAVSKQGYTRVIVEKPFGKDSESSALLSTQLAGLFGEDQLYRIDHYLGKELVQNLMCMRFANAIFEPIWNRYHVRNVQITFKEDIGTEGRGGYFDEFGIIRDVMQNHLLQIFALVGMEPPVTLQAEDVRDEKVKLLRAVPPLKREDVVIGQYGPSADGKEPGYLDDKTVPKGSVTPTFATAVLYINNQRWKGVPFILKCGKALNERKAEVRIQLCPSPSGLFESAQSNEIVIRLQPNEAIYMKLGIKKPGLSDELDQSELDLTYSKRYNLKLPDAYERLIYDVLKGDHNLFVRDDELEAAWKIFTPLLHELEREKVAPIIYPFGSRGPAESDELIKKCGFVRTQNYNWSPAKI